MYKVEIITEPDAQDLAVLRRREMEEQRKKRIFNPKLRVIGIDVKALEEQIEAKNRRKLLDDLRDKSFESAVTNNNTILEALEKRALRARREQLQEVNKYRLANQRQDHRREYDLNMPSKQRNELLRRDGYVDNDAPPPVSGLQGFGGEDKEAAERARLQKEQMKVWMIESLLEKKKEQEQAAQEKRAQEAYLEAVVQKQLELEHANAKMRVEQALNDLKINQVMASWKQKAQLERKRHEDQANFLETHKWKGDFLSSFDADGLASFRGMTDEQRHQIFADQARQREENENRHRAEIEDKAKWAKQEAAAGRLASVLEQEQEKARKETLQKLFEENGRLACEAKAREHHARREVFNKAPTEAFFAQFNTSSR